MIHLNNKGYFLLTCVLLFISLSSTSQNKNTDDTSPRYLFNKELNWKIAIPEGFNNYSQEVWNEVIERGYPLMEQTAGQKIEEHPKMIFLLKADEYNVLEANKLPFNPKKEGEYAQATRRADDQLYLVYKQQMPAAKIDTSYAMDKIDDLEFYLFKLKVVMPSGVIYNVHEYSRPFGDKTLCVNIIFIDDAKGKLMSEALHNSTFSKFQE